MKKIIPFIILFGLCILLYRELYYAHPEELPSTLIGHPIPAFTLNDLNKPQNKFTQKNLINPQVSLLNVWATWCDACLYEHSMLMKIANQYHVPLYGILYKDNVVSAKQWLDTHGNPYISIGNDASGDVGIDLGVYGTPETFLIDNQGKIIYRHVGVINQENWDKILHPMITQLNGSK